MIEHTLEAVKLANVINFPGRFFHLSVAIKQRSRWWQGNASFMLCWTWSEGLSFSSLHVAILWLHKSCNSVSVLFLLSVSETSHYYFPYCQNYCHVTCKGFFLSLLLSSTILPGIVGAWDEVLVLIYVQCFWSWLCVQLYTI